MGLLLLDQPNPYLCLPGCEAFPQTSRPGPEADGPGQSGHDRKLQC